MSLMDGDPKYAKLYVWRWTHGFATDPNRMCPRKTPLRSVIFRLSCDGPIIDYRSIQEATEQLAEWKWKK